jgi:hypothetical protein
VLADQAIDQFPVPYVAGQKGEPLRPRTGLNLAQIALFAGRGVVVVEVIQSDNLVATNQHLLHGMAADESSGSGYQNFERHSYTRSF